MLSAKDKLIRARVHLQSENPFFSYLVMRLNIVGFNEILKDSQRNDKLTMAVDAKGNLYYSDDFVNSMTDKQIKGVLCHEVLHCAFEHMIRAKNRNHELWNIATDLVINDLLVTNNFDLPKEGLIPENHTFTKFVKNPIVDLDKKSAELVYEELFNQLPKQQQKALSSMGFDGHIYSDESTGKQAEEIQKSAKEWRKALIEASTYAKIRGNLPVGIDRIVGELTQEKINWRDMLYRYITNEIPYDYSYSYPSKRSQSLGVYMPHIRKERIDVVVAIDTSGSIQQTELNEFLSEMVGIAKSFHNIKMTAIICDCKIYDVLVFENGSIAKILETKVKGGGGTSHKPVYDYIQENIPQTKILINFTDGHTDYPDEESTRTIWAISTGGLESEKIPFGVVVRLGQ